MKIKNYLGLCGALLIIGGGLSPMVHLPIIGNWNYWDLHSGIASIVYVLAALAIIAAFTGKSGLLKFCGWAELLLILLTLVAVHFKVNDSFSFIPFKKLARAAAGIVHYRWSGWILLLVGAVVMIIAGRRKRTERAQSLSNQLRRE
ncbi:hypothetical protein [Arcticibacter tournemirensis]